MSDARSLDATANRSEDAEQDESRAQPGRPPKYKPTFAGQAAKLCALGATDADLADFFEVTIRTIANWRTEHPEFFHAVKEAKEAADARVERSLYQRATGYSHDATKIFMPAGAKEPVYAPYREHYPPDTAAAIFWLKNRQPKDWREKIEFAGEVRHFLLEVPPEAASSEDWAKS